MPYDRITDLPDGVRDLLSKQAQLVYKEAFNQAWSHFSDLDEFRIECELNLPTAELAHKSAWNAVNRIYESQVEKLD